MTVAFVCDGKKLDIRDIRHSRKFGYNLDFGDCVPLPGDVIEFKNKMRKFNKIEYETVSYIVANRTFECVRHVDSSTPWSSLQCTLHLKPLGKATGTEHN